MKGININVSTKSNPVLFDQILISCKISNIDYLQNIKYSLPTKIYLTIKPPKTDYTAIKNDLKET